MLHYRDLIKEDPAAYLGIYHWEVHAGTNKGDLWLPFGYGEALKGRMTVVDFLKQEPAAEPPPGSSVIQQKCDKAGCIVNI